MFEKNHLRNYIEELTAAFREDRDIDFDVVLVQIQEFRDQLDAIQAKYEGQPTQGAAEFQTEMLHVVRHFLAALEHLEDFLDEVEEDLLSQALTEAKTGDDKLRDLMDLLERESGRPQALG